MIAYEAPDLLDNSSKFFSLFVVAVVVFLIPHIPLPSILQFHSSWAYSAWRKTLQKKCINMN